MGAVGTQQAIDNRRNIGAAGRADHPNERTQTGKALGKILHGAETGKNITGIMKKAGIKEIRQSLLNPNFRWKTENDHLCAPCENDHFLSTTSAQTGGREGDVKEPARHSKAKCVQVNHFTGGRSIFRYTADLLPLLHGSPVCNAIARSTTGR